VRVSVHDLVGRPGSTRSLTRVVDRAEVGDPDDDWGPAQDALDGPLRLDLTLEAVVDGILVRGTVDVDLVVPCSRCLEPLRLEHTGPVAELFLDPWRRDARDADVDDFVIDDDRAHLDLTAMLHDVVVMEIPVQVRCDDDCRGLCPTCGANRNDTDCGHGHETTMDPRWAALQDLRLPES
jgi:uncharacterized protein